jgi:4-oxalomesaconate tautomerase
MQKPIPCSIMRGGTSKGLYFLASDLPQEKAARDRILLAAMGSPDARQLDGVGGAHPLTSKVAVVGYSLHPEADVEYLFLQVAVDRAEVTDSQNCGNILAAVGPFAIEQGLVPAGDGYTDVRILMANTGALAVARVQTPGGMVNYQGAARIDGVPGSAAPVPIEFLNIAGSSCGALLPTGNAVDRIDDIELTCVDNGMPVVLLRASDFGLSGAESPAELEANAELKQRLEAIRLEAGRMMTLGDVSGKTVPKMCLLSPPLAGGVINTRTFIPHRVHEAIGVLGSISVATACMIDGSVAEGICGHSLGYGDLRVEVEHPTGFFTVELEVAASSSIGSFELKRVALLRTARLLMRGEVMVPVDLDPAA